MFTLSPALVWLPLAEAMYVNPEGRPSTVTLSMVRASPSYTFSAEAAVMVMGASFPVMVSVVPVKETVRLSLTEETTLPLSV